MKNFKRVIVLMISVIMCMSGAMVSLANTETTMSVDEATTKRDLKEVQSFMDKQQVILTLEEQTQTFLVPLSTGETATVTIELTKADPIFRDTILDAKLGDWDIDYNVDIPHSGSIKLRASFTVTHVPDMSSSSLDWAKFHVTGSTITAVPPQGASIADKGSSYTTKMTDAEYLIDGYVTFDVSGKYTMNYYVEMLMYSPGNSGDNRNKICVDTNLSV